MHEHDVVARLALQARVEREHRQRPAHVEEPCVPVVPRGDEYVRIPLARRESLDLPAVSQVARNALAPMLEVHRYARVPARLFRVLAAEQMPAGLVQVPYRGEVSGGGGEGDDTTWGTSRGLLDLAGVAARAAVETERACTDGVPWGVLMRLEGV